MSRLFALLLAFSAGAALADGGDWKMGPFGPYWDENEWPEFTPMYWMEEFMNRLDDDDDDIRDWLYQQNQPQGTAPQPGAYPMYGWNNPSPYGWQPYGWYNPWVSPYGPYAYPYGGFPGSGWETPLLPGTGQPPLTGPYPTQQSRLPDLTPEEYSRMPPALQREYRQAYERRYRSQREMGAAPRVQRQSLPNLTPEEFARMPPALQRQYKRDFDREYARYRSREAWQREQRRRFLQSREKKRVAPAPYNRYPGK